MRTALSSVVVIAATLAVTAATADAATAPRFVGTPSVRYEGTTIGVVARLDAPPPSTSMAAFYVAPRLEAGQRMGSDVFGGNPPGAIGDRGRHCYAAEAIQPRPRAALRDGAHWRIGLTVGATRLVHTRRIILTRLPGDPVAWQRAAARRLGCFA